MHTVNLEKISVLNSSSNKTRSDFPRRIAMLQAENRNCLNHKEN